MCESHSIPGGAAHAWVQDGYHFESGPSLYSGMAGRCACQIAAQLLDSNTLDTQTKLETKWMLLNRVCVGVCGRGRGANPLAHVLQAVGEPLDLLEYNSWNVILPEGQFLTEVRQQDMLRQVNPGGIPEWRVSFSLARVQVGNVQFEDVLRQVSPGGIPEWQVSLSLAPCLGCQNGLHKLQ